MSDVIRSPFQAASQELITKLVKAGYLQPALRNDADAITTAIARLKENLRGGRDDGRPSDAQTPGVHSWKPCQSNRTPPGGQSSMVYVPSVMLPIYAPAISDTRSSARQAKKKPRREGSGAGREELRTGGRGRSLVLRGNGRPIWKVRAGLPCPSLNAAAFSSSAGFPNG